MGGGRAPAFEVRQGCNAVFAQLEIAAGYLAGLPERSVALLTGSDNFGAPLIDRFNHGWQEVRDSILGDSGTALVVSRHAGYVKVRAVASIAVPELEHVYRGTDPLFPPECTVGVKLDLARRAAQLPDGTLAGAAVRISRLRTAFAKEFLAAEGVEPAGIARATHVHAGTRRYLDNVLRPIGIDPDRGMLEFGRSVGHLGVSDHVASLAHLLRHRELNPGDLVLMVSNGAGTTISCALLEIQDLPALSGPDEEWSAEATDAVEAMRSLL